LADADRLCLSYAWLSMQANALNFTKRRPRADAPQDAVGRVDDFNFGSAVLAQWIRLWCKLAPVEEFYEL